MSTVIVFVLALVLAWPLGRYMARVFRFESTWLDRVFGPLEARLFRWARVSRDDTMTWQRYAWSLFIFNAALGLLAFLIFVGQGLLPLNPDHLPGLDWDLALHTAASFMTNTDQQHYAGQAQLSVFSQTFAVVALQFLTPASGLAALIATLRGLFNTETDGVGHFLVDLTRAVTRIFLPLVVVTSLVLVSQGVPSTFDESPTVELLAPPDAPTQVIPVGPVAPLVAIKQLGSNGGGYYGPNGAMPLENPTPLSNLVELVAIPLVPMACVFCLFYFGRRRFAVMAFGVMAVLSLGLTSAMVAAESAPNPAFSATSEPSDTANWEGKETRFGPEASAAWAALTTQTSNGSVNATLDAFNPLGGLVALAGMCINATWGGVGVGLANLILYVLLTAFIAGLMVGRTPEVFGRKLTVGDIKLISLALILQPLLVLVPTALGLATGLAHPSNPGFHGVTQVLYEYTSAAANNGSGFEGLADDTTWWNLTTTVCLVLGRFIPMLVPLAVAARLGTRRVAPETVGSLRVDSPVFGVTTLAVILVFTLLSFLPALVLGPIGEHLMGAAQ